MAIEHTIDPNLTDNAVVQRYPAALGVFNARGLDTCCGGGLPVAEAARRHGLDLQELLAALEQAAAEIAR
jgi:iron-sulfur cluster repair protein YtfE (RIC family)